jgi:RNA recognition motif-containing protein
MSELEINLDADIPLSKKELRRIKKGKTTLEELQKKKAKKLAKATAKTNEQSNITLSTATIEQNGEINKESTENDDNNNNTITNLPTPKRSDYGIWIGNLSFDTSREEVTNFLISKSDNKISKSDITRVNLPTRGTKNRGFAYIDFDNETILNLAISLSESELNGRKLLIKNAKSYQGRPEKPQGITSQLSKNPPSRILFIGNLSFDTTTDMLQDHFKHCGEIIKIRMATFEDSGKCKGFAFIDFKDIEGPTTALKDRNCKKLIGRPLRLEFGEDRSQRKVIPKREREFETDESSSNSKFNQDNNNNNNTINNDQIHSKGFQPKQDKSFVKRHHSSNKSEQRMNSSIALANAQRQSVAIVKSTGKKVTFD